MGETEAHQEAGEKIKIEGEKETKEVRTTTKYIE